MFPQERHYWEWFLLLLCLTSSLGQDDDTATPDPTADAADADTKSADDQPDPEWEYVEFLQKNIRFDNCSVENDEELTIIFSLSVTEWRES